MTGAVACVLALLFGLGSAFVPLLNAEAFAAASGAFALAVGAVAVLGLALGQSVGKLLLFEAGRRGHERIRTLQRVTASRWGLRVTHLPAGRRTGGLTVLASAALGLPPLAVVSVAAGSAGQPRSVFFVLCLTGRVLRFAAVAAPVAVASTGSLPLV